MIRTQMRLISVFQFCLQFCQHNCRASMIVRLLIAVLFIKWVLSTANITILVSPSVSVTTDTGTRGKQRHFQFDSAKIYSVQPDDILTFCASISSNGLKDSVLQKNCEMLVSFIHHMDLSMSQENIFCLSDGEAVTAADIATDTVHIAEWPRGSEATMLELPDGDGVYARCFCNVKSKRDVTKFWSKYIARRSSQITHQIVVSRYQEDVSWLREVQGCLDVASEQAEKGKTGNDSVSNSSSGPSCIIYNKGEPLGLLNEVSLPNIGRESHTYLHYISTHYDSLPDVVVFTQGNVNDHRHVMRGKSPVQHLRTMQDHAAIFGKSNPHITHYNGSADTSVLSSTGSATIDTTDIDTGGGALNLFDSNFNLHPAFTMATAYKDGIVRSFEDWFITHILDSHSGSGVQRPVYPNPIKIYPNALFGVQKELIRRRPVEYYRALMEEVAHGSNPVEGHFLERSWYYIFSRR